LDKDTGPYFCGIKLQKITALKKFINAYTSVHLSSFMRSLQSSRRTIQLFKHALPFFLLGRGVLEGISAFLEPDPAAKNLFSSLS
jgi:hypothetical protein